MRNQCGSQRPSRNSSSHRLWAILACGAALLMGAPGLSGPWLGGQLASAAEPAGTEPSGLEAAVALERAMIDSIARAERSVVAIARVRRGSTDLNLQFDAREDLFGLGGRTSSPTDPDFIPNEYATGVVVDAKGLILTAHHILREDCDYWVTTADHKIFKALQVKAADPRSGLAVLSIGARDKDLVPITLGDAGTLRKGQIVIALGNPYAIARDGQVSASWGIIANLSRKEGPAALDRDGRTSNNKPTLHHYGTLIQTDARLNLGTSGGALLNLKGEMIGMTISAAAGVGYEQAAGFAIPVDETFKRALDALKQGQEVEYGFLGVLPQSLSIEERNKGELGVKIDYVVAASPADRAGLLAQDVVTHVEGRPVRQPDDLILQIGRLAPDAQARLTVKRGENTKERLEKQVALSKGWVPGKKIVTSRPASWRGMRVDYVTSVREFSMPDFPSRVDRQGAVIIVDVEQDSPAWNEGLRPAMIISHVAGNRVATPKQFANETAGRTGPVKVRLCFPVNDQPERVIPPAAG